MRRTVLIILGVAGGVVALVLIGVAIAVATVDVNSFAGPLAARIQASTGRSFTIAGPMSLHVSLEPTLRASDVTLGNAPWGSTPAMVHAQSIEAQVALLPLLHRRFEIVRVSLVQPKITLETDAQGRGNWMFGAAGQPAPAPASPAQAAAPALGIGELEVRNGTLDYRDGSNGHVTTVLIDSLLLHAPSPDAPITGEFHGSVGGVPVALKANLGSREALQAQRWPYPVDLKGEIAGRNATLTTKLTQSGPSTRLDDLALHFGALSVQGSVGVDNSSGRARYHVDLRLPELAAEAVALTVRPPTATPPAESTPPSRYLIPETPLPLGVLGAADVDGTLAIDTLPLAHGQNLTALRVRFGLHDGRLDLAELNGTLLGGSLAGHGTVRSSGAQTGAVDLHVEGRDLELKSLLALVGSPQEVSGGKTRITLDAKATGGSLHALAASMEGRAELLVGAAKLNNATGGSGAALEKLSEAVNPFRKLQGTTELRCAVARLPLRNGVAHVDHSIAVETRELGVSASGTVDFGAETLDLALQPRLRQGVPIDVAGLADLVRVRGSFKDPQISVDPAKSAQAIARIGAAIGTGGWSLLGETLLNADAPSDSPCAIALGGKPASKPPAQGSAPKPPRLPGNLGKALEGLLRR